MTAFNVKRKQRPEKKVEWLMKRETTAKIVWTEQLIYEHIVFNLPKYDGTIERRMIQIMRSTCIWTGWMGLLQNIYDTCILCVYN